MAQMLTYSGPTHLDAEGQKELLLPQGDNVGVGNDCKKDHLTLHLIILARETNLTENLRVELVATYQNMPGTCIYLWFPR